MSRWIAALVVISSALVLSFAQDSGDKPLRFPLGGSKSQLPFDTVEVDGEMAWRITGRGTIKVEELIAGYATATGKRVTFDASAADYARSTVPYIGPDNGMIVKQAEISDYVSELIEGADLTLVGHSTPKARVVRLNDAIGFARVADASELAALPDSEWASLAYVDLRTDSSALRRHLQHFSKSRVYISADEGVMTATGRVSQLRNVDAMMTKLEGAAAGSNGMQVRIYDVAAGKAGDAARVLTELFSEPATSVNMLDGSYAVTTETRRRVTVSVVPNTSRLLVRATAADHELVKSALAALK